MHDDTDLISPRLSWQDAPGVDIAVPLFRRGKVPGAGVPQRIDAQPGLRAELRRRQAGQRAAERQAGRQLLTADLAQTVLDDAQTSVLLKLLTRALEARSVVAGQITGGTGGNDVLTLRLVPAESGSSVRTPNGTLHLPGLRLEIVAARATKRLTGPALARGGRPPQTPEEPGVPEPPRPEASSPATSAPTSTPSVSCSPTTSSPRNAPGPARSRRCCAGPT